MEKNIQYYMSLPYATEVVELPEDQGGGVVLCHPELGRNSANAWGETYEEALSMLIEIKHDIFQRCIDEDLPIPEPAGKAEQEYSGKLLLRMPKMLHRSIARMAEENSLSINSCLVMLLTRSFTEHNMEGTVASAVKKGLDAFLDDWPKEDVYFRVAVGGERRAREKANEYAGEYKEPCVFLNQQQVGA